MSYSISIIFIIFFTKICFAALGEETGLEIPRYISLKTDDANIRIGPSKNYPIILKFVQKNYPLKVIDEYRDWRKVEDFKNNIGWIHKSLVSGNRTGIILRSDNLDVKVFNTVHGKEIGKVAHGNIIKINKCKTNWCLISIKEYKGWVNKKNIWGVDYNELFKINLLQNFEDIYWKSVNYFNFLYQSKD